MADTTIEWTDKTWNPTRGCSIDNKDCTNCYAMKMAHRFSGAGQPYEGLTTLTKGGPVWTGVVRTVPEMLDAPLHWRAPKRIFVDSMSDLFHEAVPDEFIGKVFGVMGACDDADRGHTFQILTKRPQRMLDWVKRHGYAAWNSRRLGGEAWPARNVWPGISAGHQRALDEKLPLLLQVPAAVRFLSAEPLLEPLDLQLMRAAPLYAGEGHSQPCRSSDRLGLHWVITGGESGHGARPSHPAWFRSLRDQCAAASVAFFLKQITENGRKQSFDSVPADLQVREYPI